MSIGDGIRHVAMGTIIMKNGVDAIESATWGRGGETKLRKLRANSARR